MRIRYFTTEDGRTIHKAAQSRVEAAWSGKRAWDDSHGRKDLGILTVLANDSFEPHICTLTRVEVVDGLITDQSRLRAVNAWLHLQDFPGSQADYREHADVVFQTSGWPSDLRQQVAVAMDVPASQVPEFTIGGPLVAAWHARVSVEQAVAYFEA